MPFYKALHPITLEQDHTTSYFGYPCEQREDGVYVDVPEESVDSYIACGRILGVAKSVEVPEVPEVPEVLQVRKRIL